jgi:hypothetical protein
VLAWIPMLAIAIANGALRQLIFAKRLSELHAHQLSTITGSVFIGAFIWFIIRNWPPSSSRQAHLIGCVWVSLTIAFESFMGLALQHRALSEVLHEYNLFAGRVWLLFLVWLAIAPWLFFRLRSGRAQRLANTSEGRAVRFARTRR